MLATRVAPAPRQAAEAFRPVASPCPSRVPGHVLPTATRRSLCPIRLPQTICGLASSSPMRLPRYSSSRPNLLCSRDPVWTTDPLSLGLPVPVVLPGPAASAAEECWAAAGPPRALHFSCVALEWSCSAAPGRPSWPDGPPPQRTRLCQLCTAALAPFWPVPADRALQGFPPLRRPCPHLPFSLFLHQVGRGSHGSAPLPYNGRSAVCTPYSPPRTTWEEAQTQATLRHH